MMFISALLETIGIAMVPIFVSLIIDIDKTINIINIDILKDYINEIETTNFHLKFIVPITIGDYHNPVSFDNYLE